MYKNLKESVMKREHKVRPINGDEILFKADNHLYIGVWLADTEFVVGYSAEGVEDVLRKEEVEVLMVIGSQW